MKNIKKQLVGAVAMLVVAAVMMTSVSYAWFTLSTNPEVKGISATAVANQNLEIALVKNAAEASTAVDERSARTDTGSQGSKSDNYYTWGNLVDVSEMIVSPNAVLRPTKYVSTNTIGNTTNGTVDVNGKGLYYPTYGTDGRISGFEKLTAGTYTNGKEGVAYEHASGVSTNYAIRVDYWLRTNTAGEISLSEAADRDITNDTATGTTGAGTTITSDEFKENKAYDGQKDAVKLVFAITAPDDSSPTWVETQNNLDSTTGTVKVEGKLFKVEEANVNKAYKVSMYVYLNGDVVTNADAAESITDLKVNVQFKNNNITTSSAGAMKK